MALFIRKTKKCCIKLLRKLSFNEEPDSATHKTYHRNDYVQQNNQRPTKRMMNSDSPQLHHRHPSSIDETVLDENFSSNDESDNGNAFSLHGQQRRSLRKCLQTMKPTDLFQKHGDNRRKQPATTFEEENIIFTENKIYIGINERNLKQYQTSNKVDDKRPFSANGYCENVNNNNNTNITAGAKKCNRKLNFNDMNHHINNNNNNNLSDILFEKVKYDKSKKYLQTSPSPSTSSGNSSLLLEQYLERNAATSNHASPWRRGDRYYADYYAQEDANGNIRLRDPHHSVHANRNDSWLDNKKQYIMHPRQMLLNDCQKMSIIDNPEIHYENVSCSRRTSISTTETWIDDELYDNSFNEELEKRCAAALLR